MKKIIIILICIILLLNPFIVSAANEDFTTYNDSTDPNNRFTVTSSKVETTAMPRNEDAYVYKDFTSAHFDGDFEHLLEVYLDSNTDTLGIVYTWVMANNIDDVRGLYVGDKDYFALQLYTDAGGNSFAYFREVDGGVNHGEANAISFNTLYYIRVKRVESVGTYGTIYCDFYTSEADRTNETSAVFNSSIALNTSKKDFQYLYAADSYNDAKTITGTGYVQNLDLGEAVGTNMKINISDTWKDVDSIKINIGDVWKDVEGIWINVNNSWKVIY